MSRVFMSCNLVRHFHGLHFQSTSRGFDPTFVQTVDRAAVHKHVQTYVSVAKHGGECMVEWYCLLAKGCWFYCCWEGNRRPSGKQWWSIAGFIMAKLRAS